MTVPPQGFPDWVTPGETRRVALAPRSVASTGGHRNPYAGDLGGPLVLPLLLAPFCLDEMGGAGLDVSASSDRPPGAPFGCLRLRRTQVSKKSWKARRQGMCGTFAGKCPCEKKQQAAGFPVPGAS